MAPPIARPRVGPISSDELADTIPMNSLLKPKNGTSSKVNAGIRPAFRPIRAVLLVAMRLLGPLGRWSVGSLSS